MNSDSRMQFIRGGIGGATLWVVGLLLLGCLGVFGMLFDERAVILRRLGMVAGAISLSMLSGPVPSLLTLFDITNRQLYFAWALLTIPYWVCLGGVTGLMRWHTTHDSHQASLTERHLKQIRWLIGVNAILLALVSFKSGPIAGPNYVSRGRNSPQLAVLHNLRQIDGAKQQLALERKLPPDFVPTEADLLPYLGREGDKFPRVGKERYVLNAINESPFALLDEDWRIRRCRGTQGFTIPKDTVFRLQ